MGIARGGAPNLKNLKILSKREIGHMRGHYTMTRSEIGSYSVLI